MATEAHAPVKLEPPSVDVRAVLLMGAAALVLMGGAVGVLTAVYSSAVSGVSPPAPQAFPQPRVQTHETNELRQLLSEQRARLDGYAWADRGQGLVKVPIERAMGLIARKGDKAYDPLAPASPALDSPAAGAQRATTGQGAAAAQGGEQP